MTKTNSLPCYVDLARRMVQSVGRMLQDERNPWIVTGVDRTSGRTRHKLVTEYQGMPLLTSVRAPEPGMEDPAKVFRYVYAIHLSELPRVPKLETDLQELATYFGTLHAWREVAGGAELALNNSVELYTLGEFGSMQKRPLQTLAYQVLDAPLLATLELPGITFEPEPDGREFKDRGLLHFDSGWARSAEVESRKAATGDLKAAWQSRYLSFLASGEPTRTGLLHALKRWQGVQSIALRQTLELRRRLREDRLPRLERALPTRFRRQVKKAALPLPAVSLGECHIMYRVEERDVKLRVGLEGKEILGPPLDEAARAVLTSVESQVAQRGSDFQEIGYLASAAKRSKASHARRRRTVTEFNGRQDASRFRTWFRQCFDIEGDPDPLPATGGRYLPQWRRLPEPIDRTFRQSRG